MLNKRDLDKFATSKNSECVAKLLQAAPSVIKWRVRIDRSHPMNTLNDNYLITPSSCRVLKLYIFVVRTMRV